MADYIERGALQTALQRKKAGAANGRYTDGWNDCLMRFKSMVSCFPAADVAPVVHGRMVETERPMRDGKSKVYGRECTACKRFTRSPFVDSWNYCPNCGARMDGDCNAAD